MLTLHRPLAEPFPFFFRTGYSLRAVKVRPSEFIGHAGLFRRGHSRFGWKRDYEKPSARNYLDRNTDLIRSFLFWNSLRLRLKGNHLTIILSENLTKGKQLFCFNFFPFCATTTFNEIAWSIYWHFHESKSTMIFFIMLFLSCPCNTFSLLKSAVII